MKLQDRKHIVSIFCFIYLVVGNLFHLLRCFRSIAAYSNYSCQKYNIHTTSRVGNYPIPNARQYSLERQHTTPEINEKWHNLLYPHNRIQQTSQANTKTTVPSLRSPWPFLSPFAVAASSSAAYQTHSFPPAARTVSCKQPSPYTGRLSTL